MPQYTTFYELHGIKGQKYKALLLDTNVLDSKVGFPIHQIDNNLLVILCKRYSAARRSHLRQGTKASLALLMEYKAAYHKECAQYHIERI